MKYAPVLIPTCNRINHLKRCVESIAKNAIAKETELFISVDYPPSSKYQEGYKEVLDYVRNNISGFKKIHTFVQEDNLGPSRNIEFLYNACQPYDRWILTEDDNEFSSNFLEYMNSGLDFFKEDDKVLFICSFLESKEHSCAEYNCYTSCYYQPYGSACWRSKYDSLTEKLNDVVLDPERKKIKNMIWMYRNNPWCFMVYINYILLKKKMVFWKNECSLYPVDGAVQLYLLFTGSKSMFPMSAKSRTWGNDGSGFTMEKEDEHMSVDGVELDMNESFVMKVYPGNFISNNSNPFTRTRVLKLWVKYLIYRAKCW